MLDREQVHERLRSFSTVHGWTRPAIKARGLAAPRLAQRIARAITAHQQSEQIDPAEIESIIVELDEMPTKARTKVFKALAAPISEELSQWWSWAITMPYQRGWTRRAYRARDPRPTRRSRWNDLCALIEHAARYPQPIEWHATWLAYLSEHVPLGPLLASSIDAGAADLRRILFETATGTHPVGAPSREGYIALLACADSTAWDLVVRMLVDAEREEGRKQTILDAADVGHVGALAAVLQAIVDRGLVRFSSTVRAFGVWVGEPTMVPHAADAEIAIRTLARFLAHPPTVIQLQGAAPVDVFLGLWALAVRDVGTAIDAAAALLGDADEKRRLAAVRILVDLAIDDTHGALAIAVDDPSLTVLAAALSEWPTGHAGRLREVDLPETVRLRLRARMTDLGPQRSVDIGILVPMPREVGIATVADILLAYSLEEMDPELLLNSTPHGRWLAARHLGQDAARHRAPLLRLLLDSSSSVRREARVVIDAIDVLTPEEAEALESALSRKTADVRKAALRLLCKQSPEGIAASVRRLRAGKNEQRRAADELSDLAGLSEPAEVDERLPVLRYAADARTSAMRPRPSASVDWTPYHPGARHVWRSLGAWLDEHADTEVQRSWGVELLANAEWLPKITPDGAMPLAEIIDPWWERIRHDLTDGGLEVALLALRSGIRERWATRVDAVVVGPFADEERRLTHTENLRDAILPHLARREWRASWAVPVIDMLEAAAAALPTKDLTGPRRLPHGPDGKAVRSEPREFFQQLFSAAPDFLDPGVLDDTQLARVWNAVRFLDEPEGAVDRWNSDLIEFDDGRHRPTTHRVPDQPFRFPPMTRVVVEAFERGQATEADLIDHLFFGPSVRGLPQRREGVPLSILSRPAPAEWAARSGTQHVVEKVRRDVIAVEMGRGELPTPYSEMVRSLGSVRGARGLVSVLSAIGRRPFVRSQMWDETRESAFSHLVQIHYPAADDTAESLRALFAGAKIPESRIAETAMYAPQWAPLIEEVLGWPGLESAVWWFHAHTKEDGWADDRAYRDAWVAEISRRTPLDSLDLERGAVDVEWFRRVRDELGDERLDRVVKAARFSSKTGGHKRAELFSDALRGRIEEDALIARAVEKRQQDPVRAIGLLALSEGEEQLLARYAFLRGYVAGGRSSGPARRASETAAVHIGLENLARTAGYRDPQRLTWAMEARSAADLADGPVTATDGDLEVSLAIDEEGQPRIEATRAGTRLSAVPAKSRKLPQIAALVARSKELRKQVSRMRTSLEAACVLGDVFEPEELETLRTHPLLGRMLAELILVDAEGRVGFLAGVGAELVAADGIPFPLVGGARIAHPHDLLASGDWPDLQHEIMLRGRAQPFKQAFRELYILNANEQGEKGMFSRRYAGHQLHEHRASGLFSARGWVVDVGNGYTRTFHHERITAFCDVVNGWGTAAAVESAAIEDVTFYRSGSWSPIPLAEVPARVFSETMRDLDLVVSVAHASGVDPEASESSVEMRSRIVDETAQLLDLRNVEVGGHHVRIKGSLGAYSVHLGSGIVHLIPGNTLFIIPVGAQHRGRIFLPFVDEDPRTAEIVSKVVLLAQDQQIKDPTIIRQLVR